MNDSNFPEYLHQTLQKNKITGKQLAKEVNLSPKSISRYMHGEVIPSIEMQNKIRAILEKWGENSSDESWKRRGEIIGIKALSNSMIRSHEEILCEEFAELEEDKQRAIEVFLMLEPNNRTFVLEHFQVYAGIEAHEIAILEMFSLMSEKEKQYLIRELENYHVDLKDYKENKVCSQKIAQYMQMMVAETEVIKEELRKFTDGHKKVELEGTEYLQYSNLLEQKSGITVELLGDYLPMLLTMDAKDWYLLMLVQYVVLRDRGVNITYNGRIIGNKLMMLMDYMKKKVTEEDRV